MVEVLGQRLAAEVPELDGAVLAVVDVVDAVVLAGDERGDVGRHPLGGREAPQALAVAEVLGLRGRGVGDDRPVARGGDVEGEDGLEVGLLEGGVDAPGVGHLELRVEVDALVGRVDEPVQALAGVAVGHLGVHAQLVVGLQVVEPDAVVAVDVEGVEPGAVQGDLVNGRAVQVGEGRAPGLGTPEPDHGGALEDLVADGEVEVDGVGLDVQERAAGSGLVPGQVGSRHEGDHVTVPSVGQRRRASRTLRE